MIHNVIKNFNTRIFISIIHLISGIMVLLVYTNLLSAQEITTFNFEVKVVHADNPSEPIPQAKVSVVYDGKIFSDLTDSKGITIFELTADIRGKFVEINVNASGYYSETSKVSSASSTLISLKSIPSSKPVLTNQQNLTKSSNTSEDKHYLEITVRDAITNKPLDAVEVNFTIHFGGKEPPFTQSLVTKNDGKEIFYFSEKCFDKITVVHVTKPDYRDYEKTITLSRDLSRYEINLQPETKPVQPETTPEGIQGKKVDFKTISFQFQEKKNYKPIPNVDFKLVIDKTNAILTEISDTSGICNVSIPDSLIGFNSTIFVKASGYKSRNIDFPLKPSREPIKLQIEKKGIPWYVYVAGASALAGAGIVGVNELIGVSSDKIDGSHPSPVISDSIWHSLGPQGGWFNKVIASNTEPNIAFAMSEFGNIYKTQDGGNSWYLISQEPYWSDDDNMELDWLKKDVLYDLILSPTPTNMLLLVGLGRLAFSYDDGLTWETQDVGWNMEQGHAFSESIAISPDDSYWIAYDTYKDNRTILKSLDKGLTWVKSDSGYPVGKQASKIVISKQNSNLVLAATMDGIYRSTNSGSSWDKIYPPNNTEVFIRSLAESVDGLFFAGIDPAVNDTSGIFVSSDAGLTWRFDSQLFTGNSSNYVYDIETHPFKPGYCTAAVIPQKGIGRRTETGIWQSISNDNLEFFPEMLNAKYHWIQSLAISSPSEQQEGSLYAASINGAMLKTELSNPHWQLKAKGLNGMPIKSIGILSNGIAVAGSDGSGFFVSTDFGETWEKTFNLIQTYGNEKYLSLHIPVILSTSDDSLFIAGRDGVTLRGTIFGISTSNLIQNTQSERLLPGYPSMYSEMGLIRSIVRISSTNELLLAVDGSQNGIPPNFPDGIIRGKLSSTWERLSDLPGDVAVIAQNPKNELHLLAGIGNKIFESRDAFDTWREKISSVPEKIRTITFAQNDTSKILVGTEEKVYTINNGSLLSSNLTHYFVNSILFDPRDDRIVYVGAGNRFQQYNRGFFVSTDGGNTFITDETDETLTKGLQDLHVFCMALHPLDSDMIFVGTGDGIYRRKFDFNRILNHNSETLSSVSIPQTKPYQIHPSVTVFPNPFNFEAKIAFWLPQNGQLSVTIYNQLGQTVFTICDRQVFSEGEHLLRWNGRTQIGTLAASGVYFVKVQFEDEIKMIKLLLIK